MSKSGFTYPYRVGSSENYGKVLKDLDDKIEAVKKQISYFDTYNITTVVTDSALFASQLNALPLNQALVINCASFSDGSGTYTTGDVLLKLSNGQVVHIKSQTGGIYYPSEIEKSGELYSIKYSFSSTSPKQSDPESSVDVKTSSTSSDEITIATLAPSIKFNNLIPADSDNSYIYGIWDQLKATEGSTEINYSFKSYWFEKEESTSPELIKPFIQIFMCDEDALPSEQVYTEYTLTAPTTVGGDWVVTVGSDLNNYYIKVK